jgi:protein-disulfide isomerase
MKGIRMTVLRQSLIGILLLVGVFLFGAGCQATQESANGNSRELLVFVTQNAQQVREKALSYGLKVRVIEEDSAASQLVQALLNSPSNQYFAVINPFEKRYIAGGAVSEKVDPTEIDKLFRTLKLVSNAGVEQVDRLYPKTQGNAKLVVFSDYQCPYCKLMDDFIGQFQAKFGDKLEVDMVNFPLSSHEHAFAAAEAAECAREQGKFEPYKKGLFAQQEQLSEYVYGQIASRNGLDMKKFNQCTQLHAQRKTVRQDQYFGQYMGLNGTPTLVLNGQLLVGSSPEEIQSKIQDAIDNPVEAHHGKSASSHKEEADKAPEAEEAKPGKS